VTNAFPALDLISAADERRKHTGGEIVDGTIIRRVSAADASDASRGLFRHRTSLPPHLLQTGSHEGKEYLFRLSC
jgi:hypothetical protein